MLIMPSTKEVCDSFFDFHCHLNKGHGVVAAIYSLMYHSQKRDAPYFNGLEEQIKRAAIDFNSILKLLNLLEVALSNVTHDIQYPVNRPNWTTISYMFYVTDKIDIIARTRLSIDDHSTFQIEASKKLAQKLKSTYGGVLTEKSWYYLIVSENCKQIIKPIPFAWSEFFIGMSTLYFINKFY